jgi:hypothetical protein
MEYFGVGGKLIHEKNQKQKILWHYPFKVPKCEIFDLDFLIPINPIWVGDLGTGKK